MPTIDELRYDVRARMEALRRVKQMSRGQIVDQFTAQRQEASDSTSRLRAQWEDDWRFYQNEINWGDKEPWQSQVWIPMPWTAIEQATSIIQRALLDSPEFFGLEGIDKKDRVLAQKLWKPLLKVVLQKALYIARFSDATKYAFTTGQGYLKFRYPRSTVPTLQGVTQDPMTGQVMPEWGLTQKGFLQVDVVPPWNVFRDPRSRPRMQYSGTYIIQEGPIDRASLLQRAEAGLYDKETVGSLPAHGSGMGSGFTGLGTAYTGPDADARRAKQAYQSASYRAPYWASEWYGDILDENGDMICPDMMMLLVDGKLLFGPEDNPLWAVDAQTGRRKWPLIGVSPLSHPGRFEGQGILAGVIPLATWFSNLANLYADGMNWDVNPEAEVDVTILQNWEDLERVPGKLWEKNGQGKAFIAADTGRQNHPAVLATLQFVDQLFQNNSFVNSFVVGLPGARSYVTKGEVQIKTQQSLGIFDAMARNLEFAGSEGVALAYDHVSQYMTEWTDPSIVDLVGPQAALMLHMLPYGERLKQIRGDFNYSFMGISSAMYKSDLIGRLMQIAQISQQGAFAGHIEPAQILDALVDILGLRDKVDVSQEKAMPMPQVKQLVESYLQRIKSLERIPKTSISLRGDIDPYTAQDLADDGRVNQTMLPRLLGAETDPGILLPGQEPGAAGPAGGPTQPSAGGGGQPAAIDIDTGGEGEGGE